MDGDIGRKLNKKNQPLTEQAREINRRFANHPLTLHVLQRYGIENYLPRHACETALQRDLTAYFPIPPAKKIAEHFTEPQSRWRRLLNWARRKRRASFYQKRRSQEIANHVSRPDIQGTDLATILNEIKQQAEDARPY